MDEFIKELEEKLNENNISNVELIVAKYRKRYEFGLESGLSDDEIKSMLGSVDEIVNLYKNNNEFEEKKSFDKKPYGNMRVDIETVSDNIRFERSKDDTVHLYLEKINEDSYDIIKSDNEITIRYMDKKFFSLNRRNGGVIIISIPEDLTFNSIKISTVSGDIDSSIDLITKTCNIEMVSGDSDFTNIKCDDIRFHLVSGDVELKNLKSSNTEISTVSGDLEFDSLYADNLKIDSISGDVSIDDANENMTRKISSISGTIKINNENVKNFKKNIKEEFRK